MTDPDPDIRDISEELKEKLLLNVSKDNIKQGQYVQSEADVGSSETVTESAHGETTTCEQANFNEETENPDHHVAEDEKTKIDPIKALEEKLAVEESTLTEVQLEERHEQSKALKAEANNLYKELAYDDAVLNYSKALEVCPLREEKDRSVLHANRAAALMAAQRNKEALPDLDRALQLNTNYLKALERRARLNRLLEHLDDSLKDYEKLLELEPKNRDYMVTIRELKEQIRVRNEELKAKMLSSLKQLGNVFLKPFGLSTENFSMVANEGGGYNLQMKHQQ